MQQVMLWDQVWHKTKDVQCEGGATCFVNSVCGGWACEVKECKWTPPANSWKYRTTKNSHQFCPVCFFEWVDRVHGPEGACDGELCKNLRAAIRTDYETGAYRNAFEDAGASSGSAAGPAQLTRRYPGPPPTPPGLFPDPTAPVFVPAGPPPGSGGLAEVVGRLIQRIQTLERDFRTMRTQLTEAEDQVREMWALHPPNSPKRNKKEPDAPSSSSPP